MKKALLVGINWYPDPRNELKGCVNDVRQMADTLKSRYGFPGDGTMRILTDARATTKAILDGLAWLTAGASPGDSLVFHYSGHGSQVPDKNGDETSDRLDEILCPYDLDWDHPLTDDDLASACANVPPGPSSPSSSTVATPAPACATSSALAVSFRPPPPTGTASSRARKRRIPLNNDPGAPSDGSASASRRQTPSSSPHAGMTRPRPTPGSTAATTALIHTISAVHSPTEPAT